MPLSTTDAQPSGLSRRDFVKVCSAAAAAVGLPAWAGEKMAEKVAKGQKPSVVWLHFQECTGCTESLLRTSHPDVGALVLDLVSLDYHETLAAAAGHQIEASLDAAKKAGGYVLVVEGAIPKKQDGIFCRSAGKTAVAVARTSAPSGPPRSSHRLVRVVGRRPVGRSEPDRRDRRAADPEGEGDHEAGRHAPRLSGEPLQPARHRAPVRDLRHAPEARREGAADVRLRPRDPRGLPAPAALRRRPLRAGLRRRGPPQRLLPLQARLQGAADPRQLLAPPVLRGARGLADRHRPPVRRLHRAGDRVPRPDAHDGADREAHRARWPTRASRRRRGRSRRSRPGIAGRRRRRPRPARAGVASRKLAREAPEDAGEGKE